MKLPVLRICFGCSILLAEYFRKLRRRAFLLLKFKTENSSERSRRVYVFKTLCVYTRFKCTLLDLFSRRVSLAENVAGKLIWRLTHHWQDKVNDFCCQTTLKCQHL